jgi:hypothetical protein
MQEPTADLGTDLTVLERSERRSRFPWPRGLLAGVGACVLATLGSWAGARLHYATPKQRLLIIGDSVVSNYRVPPGSRVQDVAQRRLGAAWSVRNFAESGARIADYYLMLKKAELLGFAPDVAVLELNPSKLVREFDLGPDLDEDGRGLMWLPLDSEGERYMQLRSAHHADVLPLRKASLLFGFYEGLRALWLEQINWPARRRAMTAEDRATRHRRVRENALGLGRVWSAKVESQSYDEFLASPGVKDLDFVVRALLERGVRTSILLPPWPNQSLIAEVLSERGRELLAQKRGYLLRFCAERKLPVIALDDPKTLASFAEHWDDLEHLRSPHAYAAMGEAVAAAAEPLGSKP